METSNSPYKNNREQWFVFFLVSFGVYTITYGLLFLVDFLPEAPAPEQQVVERVATEHSTTTESVSKQGMDDEEEIAVVAPLPTKIIFDEFDREVPILNPDSRKIANLNEALLSGVVRHPDSADFENEGTIFLFGHSSYLPHVFNQHFKAFNDIQDMSWGDQIRVQSADREYVYRVDRVYQTQASSADVEIERGTPKLTLATCNSFGTKDDRYIVEATLVDEYPLNRVKR